jgi:hypothetical protein
MINERRLIMMHLMQLWAERRRNVGRLRSKLARRRTERNGSRRTAVLCAGQPHWRLVPLRGSIAEHRVVLSGEGMAASSDNWNERLVRAKYSVDATVEGHARCCRFIFAPAVGRGDRLDGGEIGGPGVGTDMHGEHQRQDQADE